MLEIDAGKYEKDLKNIYRQLEAQELLYTQRKWKVYLAADQLNIQNNTLTTVQWGSIEYDCDGIGITNYGYVTQENGLYLFQANLIWENMQADATYATRLWSAWPRARLVRLRGSSTTRVNAAGSAILNLNAGLTIIVQAYHQDGTNNPDLQGGYANESTFTVHLLSRLCPT